MINKYIEINGKVYEITDKATEHEFFWLQNKLDHVLTSTCPVFIFYHDEGKFVLKTTGMASPYHSHRYFQWDNFPAPISSGAVIATPSPKAVYGLIFVQKFVDLSIYSEQVEQKVFPCPITMWAQIRRRLPKFLFPQWKNLRDEWEDKFRPIVISPVKRIGQLWEEEWQICEVPKPKK